MTAAEQFLWQRIRRNQLGGRKFRRQFSIGPYIVDFICLKARLIVELDGSQHMQQRAHDRRRDAWLHTQGFKVLRFWDNDVFREIDGVLETILEALDHSPSPKVH